MRTLRTLGSLTAALVALVVVAGCSGTAASPSTSAAPASAAPPSAAAASAPPAASPSAAASASAAGGASTLSVSIVDFSFNPGTATAKVGEKITWTNSGATAHTVTFDEGSVKSDTLNPGDVFEHTFDAAGTFTYKCSIHPAMTGTVEVTG